jgi:hypothetical protein
LFTVVVVVVVSAVVVSAAVVVVVAKGIPYFGLLPDFMPRQGGPNIVFCFSLATSLQLLVRSPYLAYLVLIYCLTPSWL